MEKFQLFYQHDFGALDGRYGAVGSTNHGELYLFLQRKEVYVFLCVFPDIFVTFVHEVECATFGEAPRSDGTE